MDTKLNPLRARWVMEPEPISGFCSVKRITLWLPLDGTLIHHRLAPSRCWYSFTNPGRMESWVSLGGKGGRTNIQISLQLGSTMPDWMDTNKSIKMYYQNLLQCVESKRAYIIMISIMYNLVIFLNITVLFHLSKNKIFFYIEKQTTSWFYQWPTKGMQFRLPLYGEKNCQASSQDIEKVIAFKITN